jgi:Mlc titration factor MtfA (ptsG expression regulator)
VRVERPHDRRFGRVAGAASAGAGAALGALAGGWPGAGAGLAAGVAVGVTVHRVLGRRAERRRAVLAPPFPGRWRAFLLERYDHFERLDEAWRSRFEDDVRIFLAEKRVTGVGVEVTDDLRLLVAASAVTLSVGWPEYEWDQLAEVLLYAENFERDHYSFDPESDYVGEAPGLGTVILSVPALLESFEVPDDAYHVGVHEFVHVLGHAADGDHAQAHGVPPGIAGSRAREWAAVADREMERMRRRRRSDFDEYGAHDPEEFLGVAVEAFFEIPQVVRRRHGEVYSILSECFRQDPAAWDDARGLRE